MASASPEAQALIEKWRTETDFDRRDELLEEMKESNLFPSDDQTEWENYGLYPDLKDPEFLPKLIRNPKNSLKVMAPGALKAFCTRS